MIEAAEAELAGRRADAIAIWAELVADPSFEWDYPERALLAQLDASLCIDDSRVLNTRPTPAQKAIAT